eukprot:PhF_6_TR7898/c0_g3_i4/m.11685
MFGMFPAAVIIVMIVATHGGVSGEALYVTASQGSIYPGLYLRDCVNIMDNACGGGLPGAAAVLRNLKTQLGGGIEPLHAHYFDRFSVFVSTHPQGNAAMMTMANRLGIKYLTWDMSAVQLPEMQTDDMIKLSTPKIVSTNSIVLPNNALFGKLVPSVVENNIAMLSLVDFAIPELAMYPVEPVWTAVRTIRAQYGNDVVIVVRHAGAAPAEEFVKRVLASPHSPDVIWFDRDGYPVSDVYKNATKVKNCWLIKNLVVDNALGGIRIEVTSSGSSGGPRQVVGITPIQKPYSELSKTDASYTRDLKMFADEASFALANDPVVGVTKEAFNYTWSPDENIRPCFAGACQTGSLFADGIRYLGGADIALLNSGGIRGPGFPAGNITTSMLFMMNPYSNVLCTGTILGSTLLSIYNWSIHAATFTEVFNGNWGHMLLQNSNMRVRYNTDTRTLLSVSIWDNVTRSYQPLDRNKLYKF